MQAETDYCYHVLEDTEQLQEQLYREMRGRIQEADQSAPVRSAEPCGGPEVPMVCCHLLQLGVMHYRVLRLQAWSILLLQPHCGRQAVPGTLQKEAATQGFCAIRYAAANTATACLHVLFAVSPAVCCT